MVALDIFKGVTPNGGSYAISNLANACPANTQCFASPPTTRKLADKNPIPVGLDGPGRFFLARTGGLLEKLLLAPPSFSPNVDKVRVSAKGKRNLPKALPFDYISPSVHGLFLPRCPPAITRAIITIVVNAVKRVLRGGPFAHVEEEILEPRTPPIRDIPGLTNANTSPSVIFGLPMVWVIAPLAHIAPYPVKRVFYHSWLIPRNQGDVNGRVS